MTATGDGVFLARITIERVATEDDIIDRVLAEDAYGDDLGLAEALGMLRLAEHTLIDERMQRVDDEDDD